MKFLQLLLAEAVNTACNTTKVYVLSCFYIVEAVNTACNTTEVYVLSFFYLVEAVGISNTAPRLPEVTIAA